MNANIDHTNGKPAFHKASVAESVLVALIDESPTNPRKTFANVEDLAEDIKKHGVLQDVLVRPHPKKTGRFELVFGARRFRASKLAGLKDIPAKVRELDDAKVLELQIVENSQRSDIHPLEEADGYQMLHEKHGWSVEDIAAKVGKSVGTIRARLKLCALAPEARQAVFDEKITMGAALVLARIPHADLQAKALKESLASCRQDEGPVSARDMAWDVREKFMLRLVDAPFDRADATLVAGAPACSTCPKRTGNQRELFGDLEGEKDDLCTDLKCFTAKKDAGWKKRVALAKEKGQRVLEEKDAKKLIPSNYVDLAAKNYEDPKTRTNKAILGKADVPILVMRDPDGGVRELVAKDDFRKAVKGSGIRTPERETSTESVRAKKARDLEAKKREAHRLALAELIVKVEKRVPTEAFWRALARGFVRAALADSRAEICKRREIDVPKSTNSSFSAGPEKALLAVAGNMTGDEARGLCVELASSSYRGDASEAFKELQAVFAPRTKKPTAKKKGKAKR